MTTQTNKPGVHFTPAHLADEVALEALGGRPGPVLDPACGNGELLLAAYRVGRAFGLAPQDLHGIELDPELAEAARTRLRAAVGESAARNVRCGDALEMEWPLGAVVIANPPWISFSGRQAAQRKASPASLPGWPSLHGLFLHHIAEYVGREGTRAVLLLPESVCDLDGYRRVRHAVTACTRLCAPPRSLGEDVFPGVVEPAVMLALEAGSEGGSEEIWSSTSSITAAVLAALAPFPRLPDRSFGDPGVHSGNAAKRLIRPLEDVPPSERSSAAVREGRDVAAFRAASPRLALELDLERTPVLRFRFSPIERYRGVPVLLRQTASRPIAALHEQPTFFRNSLLACTPPPELDPAFCVAVLNSTVAATWHRLSFRDARQRSFPQVKVAQLRMLPFPTERNGQPARRGSPQHDELARLALELTREGRSGESERFRALWSELDQRVTAAFDLPAEIATSTEPEQKPPPCARTFGQ